MAPAGLGHAGTGDARGDPCRRPDPVRDASSGHGHALRAAGSIDLDLTYSLPPAPKPPRRAPDAPYMVARPSKTPAAAPATPAASDTAA